MYGQYISSRRIKQKTEITISKTVSYFFKNLVLGAAWSGRLPVTEYKQVGSNPIGTADSF